MSLPSRNFRITLPPSPFPEWRVPLSAPCFSEAEVEEAAAVLRSGWWTYGPVARRLEAEFAERMGVGHAIAVSSGTAALHLAFASLDLGPGDEVLTPSLTFVAAANCIRHAGGHPRFVDVAAVDHPLTSPELLERAVTPSTRGICIMHYGGYPCAMDAVMDVARRHGLWVVEDAAHAPGASWQGIACGAWGDVGCFSFFGNKNITCGEGGILITSDDRIADRIRRLRSHGMSSLTWDRYLGHQFSYDVTDAGFNYRLDDLRASILRVQLSSLDDLNRCRQVRTDWYRELLARDPHWTLPFTGHPGRSSYHLFPIILDEDVDRSGVIQGLATRGVQASLHYPPIHQFTSYHGLQPKEEELRITEFLGRRLLSLPLYPGMSRDQVEYVHTVLRQAVREAHISSGVQATDTRPVSRETGREVN